MSLDYAILGFLNYHPYSGYDLKKVFDISVRHFWPADQSQIYRTLARLMEQGYVDMEKIPQDDRPDRKVYHITEMGRTALLSWLSGMPPRGETRSAALVQVFFLGQLSDDEVLHRFESYAEILRMVLAQYDQIPSHLRDIYADLPSEREHYFWLLTLDNGFRSTRANLEWVENVIAQIKSGQVPPRDAE